MLRRRARFISAVIKIVVGLLPVPPARPSRPSGAERHLHSAGLLVSWPGVSSGAGGNRCGPEWLWVLFIPAGGRCQQREDPARPGEGVGPSTCSQSCTGLGDGNEATPLGGPTVTCKSVHLGEQLLSELNLFLCGKDSLFVNSGG